MDPVTTPMMAERAVYEEYDKALDRRLWCRQIDPDIDAPLVQAWMRKPHVVEFWNMDWPLAWIHDYLLRHHQDPTRSSYLGFVDEVPVGYLEVYDPAQDILGAHYPVLPSDIGAHVIIGEEDYLGRYSVAIGMAVNRFLFRRPEVRRIVGEPDVNHHNFLSLLAFIGYRKVAEFDMPDKRAAFMVCERRTFERLTTRRPSPPPA